MTQAADFIERIKASYPSLQPHLFLGAGVLNGEIHAGAQVNLPLRMMNRHGLVAGATGTGKTRTLQLLAEQLSAAGVPVFLLDVKGDLSGLHQAGTANPALTARAAALQTDYVPSAFPVELYSLSGKLGAPMRATVTEFGPVLLSRVLELNDTQSGVLAVAFKYADDHQLALVNLADIKKLLSYLSEGAGAAEIKESYGRISTSTSGTILRKIVALEQQGIGQVFGEPSFDIADLLDRVDGQGVISLLNISDIQQQPVVYSTFLMSLLAEIYQTLPETGDLDKPKLVFFFDEAHLLFKDASAPLLRQVEQVIRLIRSKGVGIFFCSQSPQDIPDTILAQLGNRIQHALRAFTPNDAEKLKKTARTYPRSDFYAIDEVLTSLGTGQALVTVLNEKGIPTEVAVTHLAPPRASMEPLEANTYQATARASDKMGRYGQEKDPVSAYEILSERMQTQVTEQKKATAPVPEKNAIEEFMDSSTGKQIRKELVRGIFGMLFGGTTTSRKRSKSRLF